MNSKSEEIQKLTVLVGLIEGLIDHTFAKVQNELPLSLENETDARDIWPARWKSLRQELKDLILSDEIWEPELDKTEDDLPDSAWDIYEMAKEAEKQELKDSDIAPGPNPQSLTVGEVKRRIIDLDQPDIDGQIEAMSN